jgi:hypothetical protein
MEFYFWGCHLFLPFHQVEEKVICDYPRNVGANIERFPYMNANGNILIFPFHEKGGTTVAWEGRKLMFNRKIEQISFMRISFPELELDCLLLIGCCWPSVADDA